jgi:hypothetical protein
MAFKLLEVVVLQRDLPEFGLKAGDNGTIVELYPPTDAPRAGTEGAEVEFTTRGGRTKAVVTMELQDIRPLSNDDFGPRAA